MIKINFMLGLVSLSFVTILGVLGLEYYTKHTAISQGLQQCVSNVDGRNQVIWTKECQS